MSLRRRLTVAGGGAVFVALAIASLVIYFAVRSNLRDQIDVSLFQSAQAVALKSARRERGRSRPGFRPGSGAAGRQAPGRQVPAGTGRCSAATGPAISR